MTDVTIHQEDRCVLFIMFIKLSPVSLLNISTKKDGVSVVYIFPLLIVLLYSLFPVLTKTGSSGSVKNISVYGSLSEIIIQRSLYMALYAYPETTLNFHQESSSSSEMVYEIS